MLLTTGLINPVGEKSQWTHNSNQRPLILTNRTLSSSDTSVVDERDHGADDR